MINLWSFYLLSVLAVMGLAVKFYEEFLFNIGMEMNRDKALLASLEDTPENRVKVANLLILLAAALAPLVLVILFIQKLSDRD